MTYLTEPLQGVNSMTLEQQITAEEALYFNEDLETQEESSYSECMAADDYNDDLFLETCYV